jgi:two-component system, CAI-1 autoinducer sensor kinase/phosphatase CqsS
MNNHLNHGSHKTDLLTFNAITKIVGKETQGLSTNLEKLKLEKIGLEEKLGTAITLSGSMAHELRTPLAIINLYTELLSTCCAKLLKVKSPNKNTRNVTTYISTIKKTIKDASYLIDNLLFQTRRTITNHKIDKKYFQCCSIADNLDEALTCYPFKTHERERIQLIKLVEFQYIGNPILTQHIFFNLFKNALHAIKSADKGNITITLTTCEAFNCLIFKDTSSGISKDFLSKIFDSFESQTVAEGGTGLGLSFCKMVMQSYGGDITCRSVEGKYTEFTLRFPRVHHSSTINKEK